jgi:hypothetical protein
MSESSNVGRVGGAPAPSPEPVIFTGARGGRGREWKRSAPAGVGASQLAQAARLSTKVDSGREATGVDGR